MTKPKKNGVSVNACIGEELFDMLEAYCKISGQSKTVAVERAIREYCKVPSQENCPVDDFNT